MTTPDATNTTSETTPLPPLLPVATAAARILNISGQTAKAYARSGRLRAVRIGNKWMTTMGAIRELVAAVLPER